MLLRPLQRVNLETDQRQRPDGSVPPAGTDLASSEATKRGTLLIRKKYQEGEPPRG